MSLSGKCVFSPEATIEQAQPCKAVLVLNSIFAFQKHDISSSVHSKQSDSGMALQADRGQKVAVGYQTFIAILCPLVTVVVLLRLLSRHISDVNFWWAGAFIVVAAFFAWATAAGLSWGVSVGLGKPNDALDFPANKSLGHLYKFHITYNKDLHD